VSTHAPTLAPPPADTARGISYRAYAGVSELGGMMEANRRLRQRCGILHPIDMESIEHRYTHLVNSDPPVDCIVATRDEATVGYARVEWHDLYDGDRLFDLTVVVSPDAWDLGIADAMLGWCEARIRQVALGLPADRRGWYGTFLFDGDEESRAAVERRGYELVRLGADMLRPDMEGIPAVQVPAGYELRTPEAGELRLVDDLMTDAFRDHWGESESAAKAGFAEWTEDPRFRRDLVAVLWAGGEPASMVSGVIDVDGDTLRGYVSAVCSRPAHRRRGLARAALAEILHRLRAEGATSAYLEVDAQNAHRAFALYEDLGFRKAAGSTAWRKPLDAAEDAR
jgi:mycothiol synthase